MKNLAAQRKHAARKFFILHSSFLIYPFPCSTPIIVNCMRFRSVSTLSTFTRTCWWMDTISLGSDTYFCASCERCIRPFSLIPMSTKAPKLVIFPTIPGSSIPMRKSSIVRTFLSNSNTLIGPRGSRPGFSSSCRISFKVGIPTVGERYRSGCIFRRSSLLASSSATLHPKSAAICSTIW